MAEGIAVGIDLGTTNSAVACVGLGSKAEVIANADGQRITPSVVRLHADGSVVVGDTARQQLALQDQNTARFFKLDMGTSTKYSYAGREVTPVDLSAEVLRQLRADAEEALGALVTRAVVTVPAYFQDAAREATRKAGELAGLDVLQLVNEPTAAALAYGGGRATHPESVLVYDLGGGTFDISLVRIEPEQIEVVTTNGNHTLGGKNWDDRLVNYICEQFRLRQGFDPLDVPYAYHEIRLRAEDAKKSLSRLGQAVVTVGCGGVVDRIEIGRSKFDELTRDLLAQTEMLMIQVLEDARCDRATIDGVLMVGGSTRMPMCTELVTRFLGKPPRTAVNPDECVALGAALLAHQLTTPSGRTSAQAGPYLRARRIVDVMSHSMGMIAVSADGERYLNSILIARNKPIPCREVRPFRMQTRADHDNSAAVYVTQGESDDPANCVFVGRYEITEIPHGRESSSILDIAYEYDISGVVRVSAVDRESRQALRVTKQAVPEDMSWVFMSPSKHAGLIDKLVLLAVDLSGSMSGAPLAEAQRAVSAFISNSDLGRTSIGLMSFADRVVVDENPSKDSARLEGAAKRWQIGSVGGGNSAHPFDDALQHMKDTPGARFIVVLTDGVWGCQGKAIEGAIKCHEAGIEVIAIGFGGADREFLRRIATSDEAALMTSAGNLESTFGQIAQILVEGTAERPFGGLRKS